MLSQRSSAGFDIHASASTRLASVLCCVYRCCDSTGESRRPRYLPPRKLSHYLRKTASLLGWAGHDSVAAGPWLSSDSFRKEYLRWTEQSPTFAAPVELQTCPTLSRCWPTPTREWGESEKAVPLLAESATRVENGERFEHAEILLGL
jgi:hypothetical protein